jgi:hypothetical protein
MRQRRRKRWARSHRAQGKWKPAYRAVFCAKYLDTIYILHAFAKTKNGHDSVAAAVARTRYKLMMQEGEASKAIAKKAAKTALKKAGR